MTQSAVPEIDHKMNVTSNSQYQEGSGNGGETKCIEPEAHQ